MCIIKQEASVDFGKWVVKMYKTTAAQSRKILNISNAFSHKIYSCQHDEIISKPSGFQKVQESWHWITVRETQINVIFKRCHFEMGEQLWNNACDQQGNNFPRSIKQLHSLTGSYQSLTEISLVDKQLQHVSPLDIKNLTKIWYL